MDVHPWHLRQAARALRAGGVIAYPTEGVYGLGCDPLDPLAVQRLLALKGRPRQQGLILIAAERDQLAPYVGTIPEDTYETLVASWPGPVTWLVPAADGVPDWLSGAHETIAVRVTAHPVAAALCRAFDAALVSTSANRSGQPPARDPLGVRRAFGTGLDYIVPGKVGGLAGPTEIRDARTGNVVRPGLEKA